MNNMMARARRANSSAFTIVELLIVIVVIAILAAIVFVLYRSIQDRAKVSVVTSDLIQASKVLDADRAIAGAYPSSISTADQGRGLKASDGTVYQYTVNNTSPATFCLSAVNGDKGYHISSGGSPQEGVCTGHTGPVVATVSACGTGFIAVPGNSLFGTSDFCVAKYEAKNVGGAAVSQASGVPWVYIDQPSAITAASNACSGCHLITEAEWLTIAHNVVGVNSNWSGNSPGSGYIPRGHSGGGPASGLAASSDDTDGFYGIVSVNGIYRRTLTLTNGEVIWDFAGNVSEWTTGQTSGGQPGASGSNWREWNAVPGTGSLTPNPHPSFGTPAASGWSSVNGIGQLYSNSTDSTQKGFLRSGDFGRSNGSGIFMLYLPYGPTVAADFIGFRVAK